MSAHSGQLNHDTSEPNNKAIALSVILTSITLIIIVWGSILYYRGTNCAEIDRKENNQSLCASLQETRNYEHNMLTEKTNDPKTGASQMPIEDAMKKVVNQY